MEPENAALRRLSKNFDSIFTSKSNSFSDAIIAVAGGGEVAVHRCILSARSPFFKTLFSSEESGVKLELRDLAKDFEVSLDALVTVLVFLYSGKVSSLRPEGVCVCVDDECEHVSCRPAVDFVVEVLYASFVFEIPELVALYQRHLLDILDKIAADDILVVLSLANICGKECDGLLSRCIDKVVRSDVDTITLDRTLPDHIVKQILDSRKELGFHGPENPCFPDRHVIRIYRALDSDDLELVKMLLKEGHCKINNAWALHYAVAYCDAKTTTELLDLAIADVNHRNPRGYTVLHIAAMRKDPSIIVSLLTKGAKADALTSDGRKALSISKRLTRALDYYKSTERGKASPKDRLCIEILEEAERRPPLLGQASAYLAKLGDDLRMTSSYLESRVALAKLLFPAEAKVAMDIARVHHTSECAFPLVNSKSLAGVQSKDEHLNRIKALFKTVELGKLFFPRCSEVLNDMVDNDLSELVFIPNETQEECQLKKRRYTELKEDITRAFLEDKEEFNKFTKIPSSSISTSIRGVGMPFEFVNSTRHLLDILDKIAADDILVVLSLANICGKECDGLLSRCIDKVVRSDVDIITFDRTLPDHIVKQILDSRKELGFHDPGNTCFPDRHVKRIYRALDSDDLELVKLLLTEGHCNIDNAWALHYAVAYCDAKTTTELLDLAIADVNHRNPRGYTVLHIAAMRKDPSIILSLLTKGAKADALTSDGRKALSISKRLTRASDYYKSTERGKASPKDRLCIEILEEAERRPPLLGEASAYLAKLGDDLRMTASYLESRVALAKLLFPAEAKVAMDIARVHLTSECAFPLINSMSLAGVQSKDEHLNRIMALFKTVELGKLFFPRCSEVLDDMVDNDLSELVFIPNETQEERQLKKRRYTELKEDFTRAFLEDKEFNKFTKIPSSSISTSIRGVGMPNGKKLLSRNKYRSLS